MKNGIKRFTTLSMILAITYSSSFAASAGEWVDGYYRQVYEKDDGSIARNEWVESGGSWYLTNSVGSKCIGWYLKDDRWYYLDSTGARISNTTANINGVDYTFDALGAWVPDEASMAAGRVYRSPEYNLELTVPWYFQMDMHSYLMPSFTDTRKKYSFHVTFGDFTWNTPLEEVIESRQAYYKHNMLSIEKVSNITINNRTYTEILTYDKTIEPNWCYDEFYYCPGNPEKDNVTYFGFSYNAEDDRKAEIASILATAKPLE